MSRLLSLMFIPTLIMSVFFTPQQVFAEVRSDAYIVNVSVHSANLIERQPARIYAEIRNNPATDSSGTVTFYAENKQVGSPQAVSVVSGVSDKVFVDWMPEFGGYIDIKAVLIVNDIVDTTLNNNVFVLNNVFVDYDTDGDDVGNNIDIDDDNDGVNDKDETITDPLKYDTDGDGIGDGKDPFPLDPNNQTITEEIPQKTVVDTTVTTKKNDEANQTGNLNSDIKKSKETNQDQDAEELIINNDNDFDNNNLNLDSNNIDFNTDSKKDSDASLSGEDEYDTNFGNYLANENRKVSTFNTWLFLILSLIIIGSLVYGYKEEIREGYENLTSKKIIKKKKDGKK